MTTSVETRDHLGDVLRLDLIGPEPGHPHEAEVLSEHPSQWYLTGFLVPTNAPEEQRVDPTAEDDIDEAGTDADAADEDATPEKASARRQPFPSSLGVSVLLPGNARPLTVEVRWGDYRRVDKEASNARATGTRPPPTREELWRRTQRIVEVPLPLGSGNLRNPPVDVPGSNGLQLFLSVREVASSAPGAHRLVPTGTRSISVFLVNGWDAAGD